jgi:hypothetical protein
MSSGDRRLIQKGMEPSRPGCQISVWRDDSQVTFQRQSAQSVADTGSMFCVRVKDGDYRFNTVLLDNAAGSSPGDRITGFQTGVVLVVLP